MNPLMLFLIYFGKTRIEQCHITNYNQGITKETEIST